MVLKIMFTAINGITFHFYMFLGGLDDHETE
jgi:hypothetical protein